MRSPFFPAGRTLALLFCFCLIGPQLATPAAAAPVKVLVVTMNAAISPASADMLDEALHRAATEHDTMVLLALNTPGGAIETMRRMVQSILNAPVPVAIYVSPSGARAASAGVFLVAAAQISAMAPDTTIGSAAPVGLGGINLTNTLATKVVNDLDSLLRSVAVSRGRNVDWYRRSVAEAANLTASEAVTNRVVDYLAVSGVDLMAQIGQRGLSVAGGVLHFTPHDVTFVLFEPGWRYAVLSWLLDPQVAYILLLIGVAGIFFELTSPGVIVPGVIGGLTLLPALYALSVLPTNAVALSLLLFGGLLFFLELHVTSYGLLSIAGIAALFMGSLLLFREGGQAALPFQVIVPTVTAVSLLLITAGLLLAKAQRQKPRSGLPTLIGQSAVVRQWEGNTGKVFINGELWDAVLAPEDSGTLPLVGGDVCILAIRGMKLVVTTRTNF